MKYIFPFFIFFKNHNMAIAIMQFMIFNTVKNVRNQAYEK